MTPELTYHTQDTPLAVALATCGVAFPKNTLGQSIPFFNYYNAEILAHFSTGGRPLYAGSGMSLWDAAHDAWKRGLRGRIVYNFVRDPIFERLIKVWKQHGKTMEVSDLSKNEEVSIGCAPEVAMAVCSQFAKNRKVLTESWRKVVPFVEHIGEVRTEQVGDKVYTVGSFKLISLNASPDLRAQVGL